MSCAECRHWRTAKVPIDHEGICVKFTAQYVQRPHEPNGAVIESARTKRRRGKASKTAGHIMVTWSTAPKPAFVSTLGVYFYTQASFHCALFEPRKRKRRLPVLRGQVVPATRLARVVLAED
jgi:hypothetical protein